MKQAIDLLRGELESIDRSMAAITADIDRYKAEIENKRSAAAVLGEKGRVIGEAIAALELPGPAAIHTDPPSGAVVPTRPVKRK